MTYSHETYGERVADVYDEMYSDLDPHAIDTLAEFTSESGKHISIYE